MALSAFRSKRPFYFHADNNFNPEGQSHMRTGIGYDIHRLTTERPLILGGVEIPHEKGLLGHSDADVLVHAVCDALLGAGGMGDVGLHFPDTDSRYKNASSLKLLMHVGKLLAGSGFQILNIDATILTEAPKIAPHRLEMQHNIARAVNIAPELVNVKATTTEGLGSIGRGEGIGALAIATIGIKPTRKTIHA
jgi:2-C-methyl-D-erythritol 2,4-cyclodiphosphate synthase